jgi:hypothetical protein
LVPLKCRAQVEATSPEFLCNAGTARPDGGCSVELSALTRGGRGGEPWWTVCFEAFGADPVAVLERVVPFVLGEAAPPALDADHTQDYPAWLVEPAACHPSR